MFLSMRYFRAWTAFTLAMFGVAVFVAFYEGGLAALWLGIGAVWGFNLTGWARLYHERRRGYVVHSRKREDGSIEVIVFGKNGLIRD
jgi:hypothetical protein